MSAAVETPPVAAPTLLPATVDLPDGRRLDRRFPPAAHARLHWKAIVEHQRGLGPYTEIAYGPRKLVADEEGEMRLKLLLHSRKRANVVDAHVEDMSAMAALTERKREEANELFVGVLPRAEPTASRQVVGAGSVLWVDIDDGDALERIRGFAHRPHLVVKSGSGGAHAYWRIEEAIGPEHIERANLRLVHALGGDYASFDRLRVLRQPGSRNYKAGKWCRCVYADLTSSAFEVAELVGGLPDPPEERGIPVVRTGARHKAGAPPSDDPAKRVEPHVYVAALCGKEPNRYGVMRCPLPDHEEKTGSFKAYGSPEEGWFCQGCRRGGSVYDLAAGMLGMASKGEQFKEVKAYVYDQLRLEQPAT